MAHRRSAWMLAIMRKAAALPLLLAIIFGCAACQDFDNDAEKYAKDLQNLEDGYRMGGDARKSLQSKALKADQATCKGMYETTSAQEAAYVRMEWSEERKHKFIDQHRQYFMNGCLGLPTPSATPIP